MDTKIPEEVLKSFSMEKIKVETVPGGLINQSYKISWKQNPAILLQQINKNVFAAPSKVQENYGRICKHVESTGKKFRLPHSYYWKTGKALFRDKNKNYWRAFEFIGNISTFSVAAKPQQAKLTAAIFGKFTAMFAGFDIGELNTVIHAFHDLNYRYEKFEQSVSKGGITKTETAKGLIEELRGKKYYRDFYNHIVTSNEFSLRVMHHDAKIANVLFGKTNGRVICPVDFDTAMPGYYFSDLGDLIRSMVPSTDENNKDYDQLSIRKNFYKAILSGYLEAMNDGLSGSEKKYIHYAGPLIVYMQALRFCTDYLQGDIYYKVSYSTQNYDRAKNQLILLKKLEKFLKEEYGPWDLFHAKAQRR